MAWQAKISRIERKDDRLIIIIQYFDDIGRAYDQILDTLDIQDSNWLSQTITNKLKQLNNLDLLETSIKADSLAQSTLSIGVDNTLTQVK